MNASQPDAPITVSSIDLAATITRQPGPLLFLDTAAILDISRVPYRQELQVDILKSAIEIVDDLVAKPRRVWVVATTNVMQEFQAHRYSIQQELENRITNLSESISRFSSIARVVLPERRINAVEWLERTFQNRVLGIMDRLVESMEIFRGTAGCVGKARDRLWAGMPPSSKSKQQFKDCEIFEEFLELMRELHDQGFDQPAVFVTPNSKDYGNPPEGHKEIAADLEAHGALYAGNVAWARALVSGSAAR